MNERTKTTTLWRLYWNLSLYNTNIHWLNKYIYEMYFYYIFIYEPRINLTFNKWTTKNLNPRLYSTYTINYNNLTRYLEIPIYKLFRYNTWLIITIYILKKQMLVTPHLTSSKLKYWYKNLY